MEFSLGYCCYEIFERDPNKYMNKVVRTITNSSRYSPLCPLYKTSDIINLFYAYDKKKVKTNKEQRDKYAYTVLSNK